MPSSLQAESSGRRQSGCDSKHCGSLDSNMPDSLSVKRLLPAGGLHTHTHTHTHTSHTHTHTQTHTHKHTQTHTHTIRLHISDSHANQVARNKQVTNTHLLSPSG